MPHHGFDVAENGGLVVPEDARVYDCGLEIFLPHSRVGLELLAGPLGVAFGLAVYWLAHEVTYAGDYAVEQ